MTIFREISWPFVFQRLRVLKRILFRENSNISIWYHEMFVFSESCLSQKTFLLQKIDCVFVLAIRGLLHMIKNFVLWCDFYVKSLLRNLRLKSFPKRIMVLSKTCVRFRNRIFKRFEWVWSNYLFPVILGKRFQFAIMEKSVETCPFWALTFFCSRKLSFGIWKGDFWVEPLRKVLMCSLFLDTS